MERKHHELSDYSNAYSSGVVKKNQLSSVVVRSMLSVYCYDLSYENLCEGL